MLYTALVAHLGTLAIGGEDDLGYVRLLPFLHCDRVRIVDLIKSEERVRERVRRQCESEREEEGGREGERRRNKKKRREKGKKKIERRMRETRESEIN